ncbi:MAG: SDR family oxidoreductase, partial [Actinomycetota bacterium]|nr:SDR family oxidoreductase [Actinomycetota bacterium]
MATVLITGCSSGFGRLAAQAFARKGHTVVATMRTPEKGKDLVQEAETSGLDLRVVALDVTDEASVRSAVDEAIEAVGPLDVLVNNAGIELRSSIEEAGDAEVQAQFDTNVFGLLRVVRAVVPAMRQRRAGVVVNVGSIAGLVARPYGGLYAASKHAVEAITEALHYELAPFGVRVAVIEPGQFATDLLSNALVAANFTEASPYWADSERFD